VTLLLSILAILIAGVLIVLFTPVRITLEAAGGPRPERVEIWFWSWRIHRWRAGQEKGDTPKPAPKPAPAKRKTAREARPLQDRAGPIFKLLSGPAGRRLLRRMMRSMSFPECRLHIAFGSDDPALTGLFAGPAYAINARLGYDHLRLEPDFMQETLAIDGRLALQTSLARLSGPPLRFLFEPGAARALWALADGPLRRKPRPQTQTPR